MLLIVAYSRDARQALRNACRTHDGTVVRRFGRAALVEETEFGAFLGLRLRERYGTAVQVERTRPLNEFGDVADRVRAAARAYAARAHPNTPYEKFAIGTDHPSSATMKDAKL